MKKSIALFCLFALCCCDVRAQKIEPQVKEEVELMSSLARLAGGRAHVVLGPAGRIQGV